MINFHRSLGRAALVASTVLALGVAIPAEAAPKQGGLGMCHPMSRMSVIGSGQARVAPDLATVRLGVTTRAESAADAMRQNSDQQSAVIDALVAAGIAEEHIQTSGLNLNPVIDFSPEREPTVTGYEASNMVSVRVTQIDRLGEVLDAIVGAGANQINGIEFSRMDGLDAEDQARRTAVEDALHKAEVLAEAAGLQVGRVLTMRDGAVSDGPRPMMRQAAMEVSASVPVQAGQVEVSAQVQMEFALIGGPDCGPDRGPQGEGREGRPPLKGANAPGEGSAAGDLPPPMGIDSGAVQPGEPVVPMGEELPGADAEAASN